MLTGITLENFKAFKEPQFIRIKPITLVFGRNSAGKSSIFHALAFLRHVCVTNGHCDPREVKYGETRFLLGGFQELVHGHDPTVTMKIGLHWEERNSITWAFSMGHSSQGQLKQPRVTGFEIKSDKRVCARGKNLVDRGIEWEIEVHSSHPIISSFKSSVWKHIQKTPSQKFISKQVLNRFDTIFDKWEKNHWHKIPKNDATGEFIPNSLVDPGVDFHKMLDSPSDLDIPF